MAKAFGIRSEYLTEPEFKNAHEFCYALLQNEEMFELRPKLHEGKFGYLDSSPLREGQTVFHLFNEWAAMREKLDKKEITQAECDDWKLAWTDAEDVVELRARGEL